MRVYTDTMFDQTFITQSGKRRPWTYALGLTGELLAIGFMMLLPLIYTEKLGGLGISRMPVAAPPMGRPPANKAAPAGARTVRVRVVRADQLIYTPSAQVRPLNLLIDVPVDTGGDSFVPGAIYAPGPLESGVRVAPPPPVHVERSKPPEPAPQPQERPLQRIKVSEGVQAALIIRRAMPVYPSLARQARVQGVVRLEGVIARDGTMQQLRVISGHPMLVQAALEAVRQWVYRPTYLNGEPVEVQAPIEVRFTLSQ